MKILSRLFGEKRGNWYLLFFLFAFHFSLLTSSAQTQLVQYQPGVTTDGAIYFLPKTAIQVQVLVEKSSYKPGDFARYAQRYLRRSDVSLEPSVSYRVIAIKQAPLGVADTTKRFAVKFNAKTVAANVALSDDGRLLAINAEPIAEEPFKPFTAAPKPAEINPRQYMTEEILVAGSTAKMAELTAREIYDLRENRNLLIKGQADFMPQDGNQMRLMLSQLEQQENTLTSLFTGKVTCDTTSHVITVIPDGNINRQLLFRLSQVNGLVDKDDLSGAPYYISVEDLKAVPATNEEAAAKNKKKPVETGIYVNVPGRMLSTVYQGIEAIHTQEMPAAQFGNVELLSGELFNKRYTTHLWLNPLTGAVDRLEAEQPK